MTKINLKDKKLFKTISVNETLKKEFDDSKEIIHGSIETNDQCLYKILKVYKEKMNNK